MVGPEQPVASTNLHSGTCRCWRTAPMGPELRHPRRSVSRLEDTPGSARQRPRLAPAWDRPLRNPRSGTSSPPGGRTGDVARQPSTPRTPTPGRAARSALASPVQTKSLSVPAREREGSPPPRPTASSSPASPPRPRRPGGGTSTLPPATGGRNRRGRPSGPAGARGSDPRSSERTARRPHRRPRAGPPRSGAGRGGRRWCRRTGSGRRRAARPAPVRPEGEPTTRRRTAPDDRQPAAGGRHPDVLPRGAQTQRDVEAADPADDPRTSGSETSMTSTPAPNTPT